MAAILPLLTRILRAGTGSYNRAERQGLIVANATGYLASFSSLVYALIYSLHDPVNLRPVVLGNIVSALCTAATPFFHRFGPSAAALWLATVIFSTIFYFIAFLGRDSGIQLNYIGAAAGALAILGLSRLRLAIAITLLALVCHLAAWYLFPPHRAINIEEDWFLDQLYANSAISIMAIVFLIVFYALRLARLAESQTEALLRNMMPGKIVDRLRDDPAGTIAENFAQASVVFADLAGFTQLAHRLGPARTVALLDDLFSRFDRAALNSGLEKIKTIGDAYMAVAGVPVPCDDHARRALKFGEAMLEILDETGERHELPLAMRIGIATGPVTAGVIGRARISYDVWGDTVNLAARLESHGVPDRIHMSLATLTALGSGRDCGEPRAIELKGIGLVETVLIERRSAF
ncbi:MAG: adenylate/guanylate cyclase domain-containing protein [Rhizobiales bacterium]|nr:adenylate/guanylate cyclase domain-containing protein [Hyphomicrobiales bacterium]